MTEQEISEIKDNLKMYTGTEYYYRHFLGNILYTDGVKYLATSCEAYWLIDIIASYIADKRLRDEPFQVYTLKKFPDNRAVVEVSDGNDKILLEQKIEFTDFPLDSIVLWKVDDVVLLPSEY